MELVSMYGHYCIALPGKEGNIGLLPLKSVYPKLGGFGEEFYGSSSILELFKRLQCVQGLHSFNLVSCGLFWNEECWHHPFSGSFGSVKSLKILFCVPLEVKPGHCPKAPIVS